MLDGRGGSQMEDQLIKSRIKESLNALDEVLLDLLTIKPDEDSVKVLQQLQVTGGNKGVINMISNVHQQTININVRKGHEILKQITKQFDEGLLVESDIDDLIADICSIAYDKRIVINSLIARIKKAYMVEVLNVNEGLSKSKMAGLIGMDDDTFSRNLKRYKLEDESYSKIDIMKSEGGI